MGSNGLLRPHYSWPYASGDLPASCLVAIKEHNNIHLDAAVKPVVEHWGRHFNRGRVLKDIGRNEPKAEAPIRRSRIWQEWLPFEKQCWVHQPLILTDTVWIKERDGGILDIRPNNSSEEHVAGLRHFIFTVPLWHWRGVLVLDTCVLAWKLRDEIILLERFTWSCVVRRGPNELNECPSQRTFFYFSAIRYFLLRVFWVMGEGTIHEVDTDRALRWFYWKLSLLPMVLLLQSLFIPFGIIRVRNISDSESKTKQEKSTARNHQFAFTKTSERRSRKQSWR